MPLVLVETMAVGLRNSSIFLKKSRLMDEIFGDGFNDPIAIGYFGQIVFKVSGGD